MFREVRCDFIEAGENAKYTERNQACIKQSSNVFSLEFNHFQVLEVMEVRGSPGVPGNAGGAGVP